MDFHLDNFDGPLDLLLHLISKNKVSIYDIPIAEILEQYMAVLHEAEHMDLDVAGDFIAMAAQLVYIKSRMLLPKHEEDEAGRTRERVWSKCCSSTRDSRVRLRFLRKRTKPVVISTSNRPNGRMMRRWSITTR